MRTRQLLARCDTDALACHGEVSCLSRLEREAECVRIGDRVPHAAERHVDRQRPEPVYLERCVEVLGEARDVGQLHALALPVRASRRHFDDAGRRFEPERRLRLLHLHHSRLEQHRDDAHRVRARHRGVLGRLHDDVARVAVLARRRHDQVRVHGDASAGLAKQQPAERVVARERLHLLEDAFPGRRQHAADDDVADLAACVAANDRDRTAGPHAGTLEFGVC
jgi:hypothetical protein